jgi:hypothetical protein
MQWFRNALPLLGALVLSSTVGCYKATFQQPQATPGALHEEWTSFYFWGLAGEEHVDARKFCPAGDVVRVRTGANAGTAVVSLITLGIYMPRKVYVTCGAAVAQGQVAR